ncbi:MAG: DMT family transporter [Sphingomonadales bacterium]|nr:DMT family transporter [Sphingomonadales bacterium]
MAALALVWGTSFLSNRAALAEAGVLSVVTLRVGLGAAALWLWIALRRIPVPRAPKLIGRFLIMGMLNNVIPFSLIVWGQKHIESGLAAILNASTALFGVAIAAALFADERLTRNRVIGTGLGFAGVVLAIGPEALSGFDLRSAGQIAVLGASASYGLAAAYARSATRGLAPELAAAGMLSGATLWMIPLTLMLEGLPAQGWGLSTWGALIWLGVGCSALAYLLYYRILALAGAGNLLLVTLMIPPVAIVAGALVYHEQLGLTALGGFALLAAGLLVLNRKTP